MANYRRKLKRRKRSCGMCKPYKRAGNSMSDTNTGRFARKEMDSRKRFQKAKSTHDYEET